MITKIEKSGNNIMRVLFRNMEVDIRETRLSYQWLLLGIKMGGK